MTAITFPNSPSSGDTHTAGNGIVYTYDGEKWTSIGTNSAGTWTRSGTEVSLTNAGDDLNVDSGTLFVDASTDRVGVGTTSIDRLLHVQGAGTSGTQIQIEGTSASAGLKFVPASGDNWELQATTNSALIVYNRTDGAERMRIDSSGKVGIGTASNLNGLLTLHQNDDQLFLKQTDGDSGFVIGSNNTNGDLAFKRRSVGSNSERMRILSGGGLTFNGDTAQANALDDYEEGTWTPTVTSGTVSVAQARYTKIGRKVTLSAILQSFSDRTTTNSVIVQNLPFSPYSSASQTGGSAFGRYIAGAFTTVYVTQSLGIYFYSMTSGDWSAMQYNSLNNAGAQLYFHAIYDVV